MASLRTAKAALGRAYRSARSAVGGTALVLTYHRVIPLDTDPQLLAIDPERFNEQVTRLTAEYNVVHASELCDLLRHRRRIPPRTVVVTFDDGYVDLLTIVRPILERHGLPATAFISTAEIGTTRERWWDELEYLLLERTAAGSPAWNITLPPTSEAHRTYRAACDRLRAMDAAGREAALEALAASLGIARPRRPEYRTLTAEEIRLLASGGLVEIGAHTASHQMLSAIAPEAQLVEIAVGKQALEGILDGPVSLFSYPYGGPDAFDAETRSLVEGAGFSGAFANWFGLAFPWTDRFAIPRCPTEDVGGDDFAARLETWFTMGR